MEEISPATLYVVATPIGNMEDISFRAVRVLGAVDALACEDTRFTRKIYERYRIPSPRAIFSYREHNEAAAGNRIIHLLEEGNSVAICTDGGYPAVSDPGYRIISACRDRNFKVEVVPGANAALVALVTSGLPTSSFTFKGFPPRKPGPRKRWLEMERDLPHTLIIYESPYRVAALLTDAAEVFGNRLAAVCVELTKKFEVIHRGYLQELATEFEAKTPKGEISVVIAGSNPKFEGEPQTALRDGLP